MQARDRHTEELAARLRDELIRRRRSRAATGSGPGPGLEDEVRDLAGLEAGLLAAEDRERAIERVLRDTVGLGPLEEILSDPDVEEVMINGHRTVYVERGGRIEPAPACFGSDEELRDAIERILAPLGRRVDELHPMADARLADGSRVNVVIPPLAVDGPVVSIRRFGRVRPGLEEMVEAGTLRSDLRDALVDAVGSRRTLLVSGGTGSGKTTFLNALSAHIPEGERVVTVEDAAELRLEQAHVVRLESRPATVEGRGEVTIRDLLRNALRMRPDRIVLGEVRGVEALDLLNALNTGHEGALSTVHANSPGDALRRLESLTLMAGVGLPHASIREQLERAVDVIVHLRRLGDGRRVVDEVYELGGAEDARQAGGGGEAGPASGRAP